MNEWSESKVLHVQYSTTKKASKCILYRRFAVVLLFWKGECVVELFCAKKCYILCETKKTAFYTDEKYTKKEMNDTDNWTTKNCLYLESEYSKITQLAYCKLLKYTLFQHYHIFRSNFFTPKLMHRLALSFMPLTCPVCVCLRLLGFNTFNVFFYLIKICFRCSRLFASRKMVSLNFNLCSNSNKVTKNLRRNFSSEKFANYFSHLVVKWELCFLQCHKW